MKKLVAVGFALALSGCGGGYDSLPPLVSDGGGGTIGAGSTFPAKEDGKWKYGDVGNESGIFLLSARIDATNTYTVPKYPNLKQRSWIQLEKIKSSSGEISKRFTIFAPEQVKCTPTCDIRIKFNSQIATYSFEQRVEGVLHPVNDQLSSELFNKTTQSNSATVYLPIVGLSDDVESEFNLRGYDKGKMTFADE